MRLTIRFLDACEDTLLTNVTSYELEDGILTVCFRGGRVEEYSIKDIKWYSDQC